ncbi:MAG: hypothetical protein K1X86_09890 [Ignavibacteria bacterium]|nr:hypothetical protein [Ignavibacteria bacterium]
MDNRSSIQAIKKNIEKKFPNKRGWIAAIDKNTGNFVLGKTLMDASKKARRELKKDSFDFIRIGSEAVYSFSGINNNPSN